MSTENALLTILVDRINNDTLVLPTLPEVAVKVRQAADNPNVNLMDMADVISVPLRAFLSVTMQSLKKPMTVALR